MEELKHKLLETAVRTTLDYVNYLVFILIRTGYVSVRRCCSYDVWMFET